MAVVGFTTLGNTSANSSYYEAEVAGAAEDSARAKLAAYYATSTAARWLSLSGQLVADGAEVQPGEITRAFEGHAPQSFHGRDRAGREIEATAIADKLDAPTRRAAMDMTISQPKSYSALVELAELAGEAALVRDLREARHDVVRDVVKHALELGLVQTRRGHGGRETETPADVMVAVVPHSKSRAGDPQEHDHVLIFNGSLRADGTTGALENGQLVTHKFYLQALVAAGVAERVQRLGFAVTETGRGQWELAGAPGELLAAWSTRRAEVLAGLHGTAAELAHTQAKAEAASSEDAPGGATASKPGTAQARREAKQAAALKSRRAKTELPDAEALSARHREDLGRLGLTPDGVIDHMRAVAPLTPMPPGAPAEAATDALFERTSVATMRQVRTAIAEAAAVRGVTVAGVDAEVQRAVDTGMVRAIGVLPTGEAVFSTDQAIATERGMLLAAREGQGQGRLTAEAAERAMGEIEAREQTAGRAAFTFSKEQRQAVLWAARGDQVTVLEGLAGTGKTTAMEAVVQAAKSRGMHTIGVAPTNTAAETLRAETHAHEHLSLQGLAHQLTTGHRILGPRDHVLLDEAGMAELSHVATVVRAARASGAQVVLVGDQRQFAPIGAGAPFAALGSVLGSSRMTEIRRQRVPWQTAASRQMASGNAEAGTLAYAAEGRWTFGRDRADAMAQLVRDWMADLARAPEPGSPASRIVVARANEDVHALNTALRQVLIDRGALGANEITVRTLHRGGKAGEERDLAVRAGDELIVWRKVPNQNLNNGDRIRILGFAPMPDSKVGDVMLTWRTEKTGLSTTAPLSSLEAPPSPGDPAGQPRLPYLQHAYAVTMYGAQGRTVDQGFIYGGTGLDARSTYVALTRHRDDARVYWDRGGIAQTLAEQGERPTRAAVVEHIRQAATRTTEARSVLDFVPDADAWLATCDVTATRERVAPTTARMHAAAEHAEATVNRAGHRQEPKSAVASAQDVPPRARPPRSDPAKRAEAAYERAMARAQRTAAALERGTRRRVDSIMQALRRAGAVNRVVETLRNVPRRMGAEHRAASTRFPASKPYQEPAENHAAGAHSEARRAWMERWMWQHRVGRFDAAAPALDPAAAPQPLHARLMAGLDARALAAVAPPSLGTSPAQARTISVATYGEVLTRETATLEQRIITGVARQTGKPADQVRAELPDALARPHAIDNTALRAGIERLAVLRTASAEVADSLADGRVKATAPVLALDPHTSPAGWRVELHRAGSATAEHAPPPDPAADRAVLDGRERTVADTMALLHARRASLGVASGVPPAPGSAAAVLDGAIGTLGEAVAEGRISPRAPMAAVPPIDRPAWRQSVRAVAEATARDAGASRGQARQHGQRTAAHAYERERAQSQTLLATQARDATAPAAERAAQAAIDAMRRNEMAMQQARRHQAEHASHGHSPSM